ncbi:MAG TPA: glycosyltransferase family 2 protein [Thermoanaerobaculia bacterium]|nr:glycosyltransferase family 2 protein [Thermoanaerobaculia bacterium]
MNADIDVIVLDLDGGDSLLALLRSLELQTIRPARVVIVDNGSNVSVERRLRKNSPLPLHLIRSEENLGFTGGINLAMREVSSRLVAWINNDVVLAPDWLEALRHHFEDPEVAAVQSIIAATDGSVDGAGISISNGIFEQELYREDSSRFSELIDPWGISATAAMYRCAALQDVALGSDVLHPEFFAYYEDVELSARLRAQNWVMRIEPRVLATHEGSRTSSRLGGFGKRLRVRNRYFVRQLHPGVGRYQDLLAEDARRIWWELGRGRFREAFRTARGVLAGMQRVQPASISHRPSPRGDG